MKTTTKLLHIITFTLICVGSFPKIQAVSPPPDGGYPGGNTAEGQSALLSLTTGTYNTAVGLFSLGSNTTGKFNTATGAGTLLVNTADENTATGAGALLSNTTGIQNTANGTFALFSNTEGFFNTATGYQALFNHTTGNTNTANGAFALVDTTGNSNTGIGYAALSNNTIGNGNTAVGFLAGTGVDTATNVIAIGIPGFDVSNTTWIGNIYGTTTVSATTLPVVVSDGGQLGTAPSSGRFKKQIKSMDSASEAILALKPVTFRYKSDTTSTPQFGLIAEEVAAVNPDLVVRDKKGEVYTVRYDAVNAMLLNEFLKEHCKVEKLEATIARQQKQIEALAAGLQKVTAQIEMKEQTLQIANNQ
jgi:trimeric autotransporter adhesin